jgi:cytochrome P450
MEVYNEQKGGLHDQRPNFLDNMLQLKDSEQMSEQHLRDEVNTIMFAGHDTTAHAGNFLNLICDLNLF